ncbi:uncharacterized protein DS421_13g439150 [Arachis hypogaea]|nr:uncharacterized protein DS421_13g439150 [Arachis hypogaea]
MHQTPPLPASPAAPHRLGGTNYQYYHPVKFRRERTRTRATLDDTEIGQLSSTPLLVEDDKPSKEVEESVKVLKDAAKTRNVAAEKVLSALSVIEKAKIDPSGFLETLGMNRRKKDSAKKRKFADFQKEEHEARNKVPNSDKLSLKRIDSATFEVHVKQRRSKEERSALAKAGREDRGKYIPKKAANQKKTGGLSNCQKERKKKMPVVAKREKITKSHLEKKKNNQRAGKQFRGRKA